MKIWFFWIPDSVDFTWFSCFSRVVFFCYLAYFFFSTVQFIRIDFVFDTFLIFSFFVFLFFSLFNLFFFLILHKSDSFLKQGARVIGYNFFVFLGSFACVRDYVVCMYRVRIQIDCNFEISKSSKSNAHNFHDFCFVLLISLLLFFFRFMLVFHLTNFAFFEWLSIGHEWMFLILNDELHEFFFKKKKWTNAWMWSEENKTSFFDVIQQQNFISMYLMWIRCFFPLL